MSLGYTIVVTTFMSIIKKLLCRQSFVLDCFHCHLSIRRKLLFRLGDEYYKVFTECVQLLASEDLYENPNSLESKKHQAFMSAQACADIAKNMSAKMTKCNDVDVMGKINEALVASLYVGFDVSVQEYHILYPHWVSISATTKVPASSSKQQTD